MGTPLPRVLRSICAPLGYVVVGSGIVGYVIAHWPERYVPMPYSHTILLVVAALAYIKAYVQFNLYQPNPRYVAELACAIQAEVCRHSVDGTTKLHPVTPNPRVAYLGICMSDGAAIVYCVGPDEQQRFARRFEFEPSGRIRRCRGDEEWRTAPLLPQLTGLLQALRCYALSTEASWAHQEDR